jgi:hypothetical protein
MGTTKFVLIAGIDENIGVNESGRNRSPFCLADIRSVISDIKEKLPVPL